MSSANLIPTGDCIDNTPWLERSSHYPSSTCDDNTMASCWYVGVADETSQITTLAPYTTDGPHRTINENGDFIQEIGKGITGFLHKYNEYSVSEKVTKYFEDDERFFQKENQNKLKSKNDDFNARNDVKKTLQTVLYNENDNYKKNVYKHVPHKDRPPLIVARRNARERRRVEAVNSAFLRLRKIVPVGNNRGKRISKVKTLQTAIDYIYGLEALLRQSDFYQDIDIISKYRYHTESNFMHHSLEDFENEF